MKLQRKLVELPEEVWQELYNRGYRIPRQPYDVNKAIFKLDFEKAVQQLSYTAKVKLLKVTVSSIAENKVNSELWAILAHAVEQFLEKEDTPLSSAFVFLSEEAYDLENSTQTVEVKQVD